MFTTPLTAFIFVPSITIFFANPLSNTNVKSASESHVNVIEVELSILSLLVSVSPL